jgi:hypothetical protein
MHGIDEKCVQTSGQKPEVKRPLKRPRHSWEDKTRIDLTEIVWKM